MFIEPIQRSEMTAGTGSHLRQYSVVRSQNSEERVQILLNTTQELLLPYA